MRWTLSLVFVAATCLVAGLGLLRPPGVAEPGNLAAQATTATDGEPAARKRAIAQLRAAGPAGLEALLALLPTEIGGPPAPALSSAIEAVAAQKDAWASGLYWYTDLSEAQDAARAQGKAILSLRLLGRLDEDLSCANSRFFRTALYPNQQVAALLRERFVLHWQSERPVPVVTIDFGDGRSIRRTVTGNSIHYVLTPDGRVVDALPGLYGPGMFLQQLRDAEVAARTYAAIPSSQDPEAFLRMHHQDAIAHADQRWPGDLAALRFMSTPVLEVAKPIDAGAPASPLAVDAALLTRSKITLERPLLRQLTPDGAALATATEDVTWRRLAMLHLADARLDEASLALMRSNLPAAIANDSAAFGRVRARFEESIAFDTALNEYRLRRTIRGWFAAGEVSDLTALNERVYAEIFLTPASDPWLGLDGEGIYAALSDAAPARAERAAR